MGTTTEWPDYARRDYERARHRERYKKYVAAHGLPCQQCGGSGEYVEEWHDFGGDGFPAMYPRYERCGFCEGTGLMTPKMRGQWLTWKRQGLL